jgi:hypothetical protein
VETKFQNALLAFAVARLFPAVKSNSLEPGRVPTKMGSAGAPDIDKAHRTQVWLATSEEPAATVLRPKQGDPDPAAMNMERQGLLLDLCHKVTGTALPKA